MAVPLSQMATVARFVLIQRPGGVKRYPMVLMLEPLFRCNLACAGCGKIQYSDHVLHTRPTPDQCWAPMVTTPGGELLIHREIPEIVRGIVTCKKYVYPCTNAIVVKWKLDQYEPSKYLTLSIHLDGLQENHDHAVCRDGVYDVAVRAIKAALKRSHRVTTNTTLFSDANALGIRRFFDETMILGVEGMMISPGYSYTKAPDREHFLRREKTHKLFSDILATASGPGASISLHCFWSSSWESRIISARPEATRHTTFSGGRSRAISSTATRRPYRNSTTVRTEIAMEPDKTRSALTARCKAATRLPRSPIPSDPGEDLAVRSGRCSCPTHAAASPLSPAASGSAICVDGGEARSII